MSGGSSPKNTTTTTQTQAPEYIRPYLEQMAGAATNVATQPYQAYEGPRIAPLTPEQQAGFGQIVNRATNGTAETNAARNMAVGTLQGQGFQSPNANPYLGAQTSVGNNQYLGATNQYTGAQNAYANAVNPMANARNQFTNVANPLMGQNPYLDATVQRAQNDVVNNFQRSVAPQTDTLANFGNAFGNSAHVQMMQRNNENLMRNLGEVSSQMRGADYANSQQLMQADLARRSQLAGDDLSRSAGIYGQDLARLTGTADADLARNAGLASTDLARNASMADADVARRMQAQQGDLTRNAALAGDDITRQQQSYDAERARQIQAMMFAPQLEQVGTQNTQALLGVGDFKRQTAQDALNQAYEEFQARQQYPYQQLQFLGNALSQAQGGQGTSTQTAPNPYRPNTAASVLGGGLAGAQLGSMIMPGIGTAAGGLLGGLLGGFG